MQQLFDTTPFKMIYPIKYDCKHVLLIDNTLTDVQELANNANSDTFPIIYNSTSSKLELLDILRSNFSCIKRFAFMFASNSGNSKIFLDRKPLFLDQEVKPYSENVEFLLSLIEEFNIKHIDYLACNTLQYPNWRNYYSIISKVTRVGASNDKTGNIKYGGNWYMENTRQNVEHIYFTNQIEYYRYVLDNTYSTWINGLNYPSMMKKYGNYLYVLNNNNSISKIDLLDKSIISGWITFPYETFGFDIYDNFLYVTSIDNGTISKFNIITGVQDVSWSVTNLYTPTGIFIYKNYIYVCIFAYGKINKINLSTGIVDESWSINDLFLPLQLEIQDNYLYVTCNETILKFNLLDGSSIDTPWTTTLPSPLDIAIYGNYLYVTNINEGTISKLNLSDGSPDNLEWVSGLDNPQGLVIHENYLYVSNKNNGTINKIMLYYVAPTIKKLPISSLYSNNSQVYYKPHSLAPGGIGTVRNFRIKSRKT
jgi:DNA-binding beta-propeller fold protein YncE